MHGKTSMIRHNGEDVFHGLPQPFEAAIELHRTVMHADVAQTLAGHYQRGRDQLSKQLRQAIESGQKVLAVDYNRAVDWMDVLGAGLAEVFENCDAILTPAAAGTAPLGLETTGNPAFCSLWTYCGLPAVSLPLLQGTNGLPIGAQLVGRRGDDARLLRTAHWLVERLSAADDQS